MIEPDHSGSPSLEPVNDELTKMTQKLYALTTTPDSGYRGCHTTKCGQHSDNFDHILPNGVVTNSLCVYYMSHYRPYIPQEEIEKTRELYKRLIGES
jgi:hypothetical protein